MALWVLEPVADLDDSWWQGRRQWARVVVRAATPAFARVVAAPLDTPEKALEFGQQDPHLGSGFKDEKLYRVVPYDGGEFPSDGDDAVLAMLERN